MLRYDVEGLDGADFEAACRSVFSEPAVDKVYLEELPLAAGEKVFAVEFLPGQYDQRADSCAQCIQMLECGDRPAVAYAKLFAFGGVLTEDDKSRIKAYLINPVDSREASPEKPDTIIVSYPEAADVPDVQGFIEADDGRLKAMMDEYSLAMDIDDLRFMQQYFRDEEKREPTVTELKVIDTYWSDHCRHTTFGTRITDVDIQDERVRTAYEEYLAARREVYGEIVR